MNKETLHGLIDMLPDEDADTIFKVLIWFIPEDTPTIVTYLRIKQDPSIQIKLLVAGIMSVVFKKLATGIEPVAKS